MRLILLALALSSMSFTAHKFYVSNTLIEHNAINHSLEITMTVFTDDLEIAAEKNFNNKLRLGGKREHTKADSVLQVYLSDKFIVTANGVPSSLNWIGKEVENNQCYIYMECVNIPHVETLSVHNSILCEEFEEQINMVDCIVDGKASNFGFTREQRESLLYEAKK